MVKITETMIPFIEQALEVKLHDHQIKYLVDDMSLTTGRRSGRTFAYCIKLALCEEATFNVKRPEEFADDVGLSSHTIYARSFFIDQFLDIRKRLQDYGFTVAEVVYDSMSPSSFLVDTPPIVKEIALEGE